MKPIAGLTVLCIFTLIGGSTANAQRQVRKPVAGQRPAQMPPAAGQEDKTLDQVVLPPLTSPDLSKIEEGSMGALKMASQWSYTPTSRPASRPAGRIRIPVSYVRSGIPFMIFSNPGSGFALITDDANSVSAHIGPRYSPTPLKVYDLMTGQQVASGSAPAGMRPIALSGDGSRVLLHWTWRQERVDVYEVRGMKHIVGWGPYENWPKEDPQHSGEDRQAVAWARFITNDMVLTCGKQGRLVLWDLTNCQPILVLSGARGYALTPCFTRDGKCLLLPEGLLLDVAGQTILGRLAQADVRYGRFTVSPDGLRIAASMRKEGDNELVVWDLLSGQVISRQVEQQGLPGHRIWCADNYMLENDMLRDIRTGRFVWRYGGLVQHDSPDWRVWYVTGTANLRIVASAQVPDDSVRKAIEQNMAKLAGPVVHPGVSASLDIRTSGPATGADAFLKEVRESLVSKLGRAGITVADNQPLRLVVQTSRGEELSYGEGFRGIFGQGQIKVPALLCCLSYEDAAGTVLWKEERDASPSSFSYKKGTDLRAAVEEAMWINAKVHLRGDSLATTVYPPVQGAKNPGRTSSIPVLGESTFTEAGAVPREYDPPSPAGRR